MINTKLFKCVILFYALLCSSLTYADDSCEYARDGACDEPHYCAVGTDSTDCGVSISPADSCRFALDGVCDEPGLCDFGTDSTDCAAGSNIYQLARRIQLEVDLNNLTGSTDAFAEWHDSGFSLLICGNYFPSLVDDSSPVPQTTMFQRCQSMGGCECDIANNSFQAIAMKRNADTSIETQTWFEDGPVYDISQETNTAVVGHLRSHNGDAGNWLNAQAIRESIKLLLLHQYQLGIVHDEMLNRPVSPFAQQQITPHLWVDGFLVDAITPQAKRMNGQPIQLIIDLALREDNQLQITAYSANLNQPVSLTLSLEELSLAQFEQVRNFIATTAGQAGLMKHALSASTADSAIPEWQPSGLVSVYDRIEALSPGVGQLSEEHLQEAARAWTWLSILSSRVSPILAQEHAANAIAHIMLAATDGELSYDQKTLITAAKASAYRDFVALNLMPSQSRYPEINILRSFATIDYHRPKSNAPMFAHYLHALQLMEFTPHRDQAIQAMLNARYAEDGLLLDSILSLASFRKTSINMKLNNGDSGSVTSYAFLLLIENAQIEADVSSIASYLEGGGGFSYVPNLMELMEMQAMTAPIITAGKEQEQRQYSLLREITHRAIAASNYKLSMWRAWGMRSNMEQRLNEGLASLLAAPLPTPEYAHAFITFNRYASRTKGWQASYKEKIKRIAIDWASAYPGVSLLQYIEDPREEIEAQWAISNIDTPRAAMQINRSELLFGAPLITSTNEIPSNYLRNFTLSPKWWQTSFTTTPIPQRYGQNWAPLHQLAKEVAKQDPTRAIELYEQVLAEHNYRLEVPSMELEQLYVDTGQRNKAIELVKRFIASDPQGFLDVSSAQQRLAEHYIHSGRVNEAYTLADQASNSGSARAYQTLVISAVLARKFEVAESAIARMQSHYSSASPYLNQFRTLGQAVEQTVNYENQWQQFMNFMNQQNPSDITASVWLLPFLVEYDLAPRFFAEDSEVVHELLARTIVNDWLPKEKVPPMQHSWFADLYQIQALREPSNDPVTSTIQLLAIDYSDIPATNDVKSAWEDAFKQQLSGALLQMTASHDNTQLKTLLTKLQLHSHWRAWTDVQRPLTLSNWMIDRGASTEQVERLIAMYTELNQNCYSCSVLQAIQVIPDWSEKLSISDINNTAGQGIYLAIRDNNQSAAENILTKLYEYADLDITCSNQSAVSAAILASGSIAEAKVWMNEKGLSARCKADAEFARFKHYEPLATFIREQAE